MTDKPATLAAALSALQGRLPRIERTSKATVKTQSGPGYQYNYADLAAVSGAILPLLSEVGLSFLAKPTLVDGRFVLAYKLMHNSGESEAGEYPLPAGGTPQQVGSAITYARRYVLSALVGVATTDDDDGAVASGQREQEARPARPARTRKASAPDPSTVDEAPSDGAMRNLFRLLTRNDLKDREPALAYISGLVGRSVESRSELTRAEVDLLIRALEELAAERPGEKGEP